MSQVTYGPISREKMIGAMEKVRDRLKRSVNALEEAGIPYAVAGGHAVAAWVTRADEGGVRNTPDVDILVQPDDFSSAKSALESAGFVHRTGQGFEVFLNGPDAKKRDAVHILFAGEKGRSDDLTPTATLAETEVGDEFQVVSLEALVQMKLTAHRLKDRVHLRDMIDVGLIDATWPAKYPGELGRRLQTLLDDPDG